MVLHFDYTLIHYNESVQTEYPCDNKINILYWHLTRYGCHKNLKKHKCHSCTDKLIKSPTTVTGEILREMFWNKKVNDQIKYLCYPHNDAFW